MFRRVGDLASLRPATTPGPRGGGRLRWGPKPRAPRSVQGGADYAAAISDYRMQSRLVASFREVIGLGCAWNGGAAGRACSDPKRPNTSSMVWAFTAKQFSADAEYCQFKTLAT